jgi:hypothetical protein
VVSLSSTRKTWLGAPNAAGNGFTGLRGLRRARGIGDLLCEMREANGGAIWLWVNTYENTILVGYSHP